MRLHEARRDHYRRMAREQGFRSRSAYKLKELNKSYRIIGPGFCVLDLGCAPGGWTQVAARLAGNRGRVLGVDKSYVEEMDGAEFMRGDVTDDGIGGEIAEFFGRKVDAVICDLSPKITGNWSVDHAVQVSLNYDCAGIMDGILGFKGNALFKVFDGDYSAEFRDSLRKKFARVKLTKPQASRKPSSELYFVCLGYVGG